MQLSLRIEEPGRPAREVPVVAGMTFGRTDENDCVLDDAKVSGRHARVVDVDGQLRLEDLGSSNGTQVVGGPSLGAGESCLLVPGARIEIGLTRVFVTAAVTPERTMMLDREAIEAPGKEDFEPSESPTTAHHVVAPGPHPDDTSSARPTYSDVADGVDDLGGADESTILSPPSRSQSTGPNPDLSTMVSGSAPKTTGELAREHDVIDSAAVEATVVSPGSMRGNEDSTIRRPPPATTVASSRGAISSGQSAVAEVVAVMAARLVFGDDEVRAVAPITQVPFTIGRKRTSEPSEADFVVDHSTVSTIHAAIKLSQRRFFLEDAGSKNGAFIDGRAIPVMASRELPPDAAVRFGGLDALFVVDRGPELEALDRSIHPVAVKYLAREGVISRTHRDEALAAHERGDHAGQLLVYKAGLEPHRWGDAIRFVRAHPRRSTRTFGVLMIVLLVITIAAVTWVMWDFIS